MYRADRRTAEPTSCRRPCALQCPKLFLEATALPIGPALAPQAWRNETDHYACQQHRSADDEPVLIVPGAQPCVLGSQRRRLSIALIEALLQTRILIADR